jgi:glycosyltransferase involved in cell wall biosynthesis
MKVLNINYTDIEGGAAIACYRLHKAFLKKKIKSLLLVNKKNTNDKTVIEINNNYLFKKFFSKTLNLLMNRFEKTYHSVCYFNSTILEKIDEINPDIVHLNWIGNEMISIEEISKIKKPVIWTFQDMWAFSGTEHYTFKKNYYHNYKKSNKNKNIFSYLAWWTWNRKKIFLEKDMHIVCSTDWMKKKVFSSAVFYKNKNIKVIPNCLDFNIWKPFNKKLARKLLKLSYFKKYIIFISSNGSSDERKGFDFLLKAIQILNFKDLHLIVIGSLSYSHRKIIPTSFSVFNKINPKDINFLRKIYSAADVIVAPSTLESFGQVVVEAASCNVPAVVFKNTGLANIIKHKKTGYVAEYKNYKDLANGVEWCLKKKKINIRKDSKKYFSKNIVVNNYLKFFKSVL